jgi:hypothetical protein
MKISNALVLKVLHVLSWILFIGLCAQAGGILFNAVFALWINPNNADYFWEGIKLSNLLNFDRGYFAVITFVMFTVTVLKTLIFYNVIQLFSEEKVSISRPFTQEVNKFISLTAYLALGIAILSHMGNEIKEWLIVQGVAMPDAEKLQIGGSDVWFFMGVVLFIVSQIVKKGIEIQEENEFTV